MTPATNPTSNNRGAVSNRMSFVYPAPAIRDPPARFAVSSTSAQKKTLALGLGGRLLSEKQRAPGGNISGPVSR
jgi:hypothetical protein